MYTVDWGFCKTGIVLEVTLVVCIQLVGVSVRLIKCGAQRGSN